ncbi:o-succinylbenzoate synthase [Chloroflexi bacterium TSY]|nr:o-succinylbenzoate synthase [Chloroflexi bacterium TSY]
MNLTSHPYTLIFKHPAGTSRGTLRTRDIIFLEAKDPAAPGIIGRGECGPMPGLSIDDRSDFVVQVGHFCQQINHGRWPDPEALSQFPSFAFGLEMAQLDLANGGQGRLFDHPFTRGEESLSTHGLIWMDSPTGIVRQVEQKLMQGYRVIKMKIGALPFGQECTVLDEIRRIASAPDIELRLDANGAFSPEEALSRLDILARYDVTFLEQPIPARHWSHMEHICRNSPIPIALDEELIGIINAIERKSLLETIQPQHIILKPALIGGFAVCEEWIALAERMGIAWWINSLLESNIGLNAICQWTATLDTKRVHGLGTGQLFENNVAPTVQLVGAKLEIK